MQTEGLLKQSQELAAELQAQQRELQQTNEQLEQKAQQLAERNVEVERKNQEIEQARRALEEKATELALTSKYKSEFLANMSHELRTPLNSILILGQQLMDNPDANLTPKQVEFARTIHGAGTDLLNLISDILDLSKIESGTVTVDAEEIFFSNLIEMVGRPFRHEAENRQLSFDVMIDPHPGRSIVTDSKRLQQVLKNLLSNAFKFTEHGGVRLNVSAALGGWSAEHPVLNQSQTIVAFEVSDTGIGIALEKQRIIFEAFQQADASTSRKYGGTGLGLAICRELANLLGGEIHLRSSPGVGSAFTLYLPIKYAGASNLIRMLPDAEQPFPSVLPALPDRPVEQVADDRQHGLARGAFSFVTKPTTTEGLEDALARIKQYTARRRKRLLVVEDNPDEQMSIAELLGHDDIEIATAGTGAEALAALKAQPSDCVVLDLRLPDMSGFEVLEQIRNDAELSEVPVVVFTRPAPAAEADGRL